MNTNDYFTIDKCAEFLDISETAVRVAIAESRLPSTFEFNRRWISKADAADYKARTQPEGVKPKGRPKGASDRAPRAGKDKTDSTSP